MRTVFLSMAIVFQDVKYTIIAFAAAILFGSIFIFSSGMLTFFPEGPFIEFNPVRITTFLALVVLSGLVVPMQVFAIQKAKAGLKNSGSGIGGLFIGIASMSCCTPLLLPALLSFVGFSGTQLLFLNITLRQYVMPLSILSVALLLVSLFLVSRSVVAACKIDIRRIQ